MIEQNQKNNDGYIVLEANKKGVRYSGYKKDIYAPLGYTVLIIFIFLLGTTVVIPWLRKKILKKEENFSGTGNSNAKQEDSNSTIAVDSSEKEIVPTITKLSEIQLTEEPNYNYNLLGNLVSMDDTCIIYGEPGVGKSVLLYQKAIDIVSGQESKLANVNNSRNTEPQTVFFYDGESMDKDDVRIFGTKDLSAYNNIQRIRDFSHMDMKNWLKHLEETIGTPTTNVTVFLDNLSCISQVNNASKMRELFLLEISKLKKKYSDLGFHSTFIIATHTNKEKQLAGSSNIDRFATTVLGLAYESENTVLMTIDKNRNCGSLQKKTIQLQKAESEEGYKYFFVKKADAPTAPKQTTKEENTTIDDNSNKKRKNRSKEERYECYLQIKKLREQTPRVKWKEIESLTGVTRQYFDNLIKEFSCSSKTNKDSN